MTDLNTVSQQAFLEEIENWELALNREAKKLKQLRKVSNNKLQINTIDIALLGIESELMQYRKAKDQVNPLLSRKTHRTPLLFSCTLHLVNDS